MANELQQPTSERLLLLLLLLQYQRVPPPHCVYPWVPMTLFLASSLCTSVPVETYSFASICSAGVRSSSLECEARRMKSVLCIV